MMTDIHEMISRVESSENFSLLPKTQFLAHIFFHEKTGGEILQVGYYDLVDGTITAIIVESLQFLPPDKVFSENGLPPKPLDLSSLTVGLSQARSLAKEFAIKERPHHPLLQSIFVLQQGDRPVWAITLVTTTMHMLQIRIDAVTGSLSFLDATSLLDFGQKL